jgi:hypothetical protein
MGHRQQMTPKQRVEWDARNYRLRKEANRGHNYAYLTNDLYDHLELMGYEIYPYKNSRDIGSELAAIEIRNKLKEEGNYARIVCVANKLRIKTYQVYFRPKKKKTQ